MSFLKERFITRGTEDLARRKEAYQLLTEVKNLAPERERDYHNFKFSSATLASRIAGHHHIGEKRSNLWFFHQALQFSREDSLDVEIDDSYISLKKSDTNVRLELPFEEKSLKLQVPEGVFNNIHWKLITVRGINPAIKYKRILKPFLEEVKEDLKTARQVWTTKLKAKKELYYADQLRQSDSNSSVAVDNILSTLKAEFAGETFSVFGLPVERASSKIIFRLLTTLPMNPETAEKITEKLTTEIFSSSNLNFEPRKGTRDPEYVLVTHFQPADPENNSEIEISVMNVFEKHPNSITEANFGNFLAGAKDLGFKTEYGFNAGTLLLRHPDNPLEKEY